MTNTLRDLWLRLRIGLLAFLIPVAMRGEEAPGDLDHWVGNYTAGRDKVIQIVRKGGNLVAISPGQPSAMLVPDRQSGKFEMRGAPIGFQFVADESGRVTQLEMTGPDGRTVRFPRVPDNAATLASVRATAVNADTPVNARDFNGYERTRDSEGRIVPETYVLGEGGFHSTNLMRDPRLEEMTFEKLALLLAPALARQGYVSSKETERTSLLIMVYWGATASDDNFQVVNAGPMRAVVQAQVNRENARLLGFESVVKRDDPVLRALSITLRDSIDRLEESRYWVALVAVDLQLLRGEKMTKPLWSIRYNMGSRGVSYTEALPQMTQVASHFFGRDTNGLLERGTTDRAGVAELGDMIVVEEDAALQSEEASTGKQAAEESSESGDATP